MLAATFFWLHIAALCLRQQKVEREKERRVRKEEQCNADGECDTDKQSSSVCHVHKGCDGSAGHRESKIE